MKQPALRQRVRKFILLVMLLLFPAIFYYFSPYIIVAAAQQGIVNGSFIMFGILFVSALLFGRAWCGWVCPAGGLYQVCRMVNDKPVHNGRWNWIKYGIWVPWLTIIGLMAKSAGGYHTIEIGFMTENGLSAADVPSYISYFAVLMILLGIALIVGRMAPCHYVCWMSPFLILGNGVKNRLGIPSLHLRAKTENCIDCKLCERNCPMSLTVNSMVQRGSMKHTECIVCGECADGCPKHVIHYAFGRPR